MKVPKFAFSLVMTLALIYLLNSSWVVGGNRIPPLGKFLDPFHGFWQNDEPQHVTGPEELDIPGLKAKVTIVFDSLAIPHIFAQNDADLYLAQGYVTAMHRLWQMEFQTHAAAGRVSEITGAGPDDRILDFDRSQRRKGMVYGAMNSLAMIQADSVTSLMTRQYTAGINHYIHSLTYEDLPFEYKLLDYEPEDWQPLKCALLMKNMAQTLNIGEKDFEMTNALKLFGNDLIDILYPDRELVGDPIVDNPGGWKFKPVSVDPAPLAIPDELIKLKKLPGPNPTTGSNNWAVHGSRTATGAPLLCGDPHLNLSLPSIWYAIQLHAPGVNVMGASLPGTPTVVIGFNDSIAWSVTNAQRDLVDWFKITYQNDKKDHYLLDDKWEATRKVAEAFNVRGRSVFYDTVIYTNWGPVVYDESFHDGDSRKHYAFRWIAHDASKEAITFYKLNRAKNHADYMAALDDFQSPAQNFVFASVGGDVAMRIQGKYPVRRPLEGKFVLEGNKSSNGWQAFIPNDQNVMYKNPARGFVSSANQYPADATYPYYITASNFEAYRNRRINQVLGGNAKATVADMMKLQGDNFNLKASEALPLLLAALDSAHLAANEQEVRQILKSWDYYNTIESEGAAFFEAWWINVYTLIWDEMEKEGVPLSKPSSFTTIKMIREKPDFAFFDIQSTPAKETAGDVIRKAFSLSVEDMAEWKSNHGNPGKVAWADYKDSYIGHLLRLEALNIHVRAGGNGSIVNAHSKTHGPSWKMVVSLEKTGVKTWAVYPGGQSGSPGSPHYNDMLDRWVSGNYFPLLFLHAPDDAGAKRYFTTTLNPVAP